VTLSNEIQELLATLEQIPTAYFRDGTSVYVGTSLGEIFLFQDKIDIPLDIFIPVSNTALCTIITYENFMACADIEGNIKVYNLHSKRIISHIFHGAWHVEHMMFLDKETLLVGYTRGKIFQESLTPLKESKTVNLAFKTIDKVHIMENKTFALLEYDGNSFALFDRENHKLLHNKFITISSNIKTSKLLENRLEIVSTNNFTNSYNLCDSDELDSLILHNALSEAFILVEHNPILRTTSSYKRLQNIYEEILQNLIKYIYTQNQELFFRTCTMLEYKKEILLSLQKTYKAYPRFYEFVKEKRFALAFGMSTKHAYLQKTPPFKELQKHYTHAFQSAQKYILLNDIPKAKEILHPFLIIPSKRETIQLFLEQNQFFLEFFKAIEENDFCKVEMIVKKEKCFKNLPNYQIFIKTLTPFTQEILHLLYAAELQHAIPMIEKLPSSHTRTILIQTTDAMKLLIDAYEHNDFMACYTLLDVHNELLWCDIGYRLEKHWNKITTKARDCAKKGAIDEVIQSLGDFLEIPSRKDMVTSIFKVALYFKITSLLEQKEYKESEKAIYNYRDMFDKDYILTLLMQKFKEKSPTTLALML
jgi:hypothetical protein